MSQVKVELCPETGICSIVKGDGSKIDLMPDEVNDIRQLTGDPAALKKALGDVDSSFARSLDAKELDQVAKGLA